MFEASVLERLPLMTGFTVYKWPLMTVLMCTSGI